MRRFRFAAVLAVAALGVWATPASAATANVLDGLGTGGGRIQARIARDTASIVRGGIPWVFYGANPEYGYRLRLAKLGLTNTYQTLDGVGGTNGRTAHSVGKDVSATVQGTTVHVFYRDATEHTLRHAWLSGGSWHFETLDGNSTAGGRTTHDVGLQSFALVYRNQLNVFYADATAGDLRRAVFDGSTWRFSIIDGNSSLGGRTNAAVGSAIEAGIWGSQLHVLYTVQPSGLREAKIAYGTTWTYSTLSSFGCNQLALLRVSDTEVHVVYGLEDAGYGRDMGADSALWNGTSWSVDNELDGWVVGGLLIFLDGTTPAVIAGYMECYGSGGCGDGLVVTHWDGTSFGYLSPDNYLEACCAAPPADPSSWVTIEGVPQVFVGGAGYPTEPDIYDQVLLRVVGPF